MALGGLSRATVVLRADTAQFHRELKAADRQFDRTTGQFARGAAAGSGAFGALGRSVAFASGAFLGGAGLVSVLRNAYGELGEAARVGAQTNAVLKSTGGIAGVTALDVTKLANAIARKTGIDDEAIRSGENLLLTFKKVRNVAGEGNDIFNQATRAAVDLSVAFKQDLSGSAIQLGKALEDPIRGVTALSRVGVSFTAAQREQIKAFVESNRVIDAQKLILRELNSQIGGSAAAVGKEMPGQLAVLRNSFDELTASLVSGSSPAIREQVGNLQRWVDKAQSSGELQRRLNEGIRQATELLRGIATVTGEAADAANTLSSAVGGWENAFKLVLSGLLATKVLGVATALQRVGGAAGLARVAPTVAGLAAVGTTAGDARTKVGGLRTSLLALRNLGLITVGIQLALHKGAVDKLGNFLDRQLVSFYDKLPGGDNANPIYRAARGKGLFGSKADPASAAPYGGAATTATGTVKDPRGVGTSPFTPSSSPVHPLKGRGGAGTTWVGHTGAWQSANGRDLFCPVGTPVFAAMGGTVDERTGNDGGAGGLRVTIQGSDGKLYYYAHLSRIDVSPGQTIATGSQLGLSGDSGAAKGTPPHLHFAVSGGGNAGTVGTLTGQPARDQDYAPRSEPAKTKRGGNATAPSGSSKAPVTGTGSSAFLRLGEQLEIARGTKPIRDDIRVLKEQIGLLDEAIVLEKDVEKRIALRAQRRQNVEEITSLRKGTGPRSSTRKPTTREQIVATIVAEAKAAGVDPRLMVAIALQETGGSLDPKIAGDGGDSIGLFQLNRRSGAGRGYSIAQIQDPAVNARIAARGIAAAIKSGKYGSAAEAAVHGFERPREDLRPGYLRNITGGRYGQEAARLISRASVVEGFEVGTDDPKEIPLIPKRLQRRLDRAAISKTTRDDLLALRDTEKYLTERIKAEKDIDRKTELLTERQQVRERIDAVPVEFSREQKTSLTAAGRLAGAIGGGGVLARVGRVASGEIQAPGLPGVLVKFTPIARDWSKLLEGPKGLRAARGRAIRARNIILRQIKRAGRLTNVGGFRAAMIQRLNASLQVANTDLAAINGAIGQAMSAIRELRAASRETAEQEAGAEREADIATAAEVDTALTGIAEENAASYTSQLTSDLAGLPRELANAGDDGSGLEAQAAFYQGQLDAPDVGIYQSTGIGAHRTKVGTRPALTSDQRIDVADRLADTNRAIQARNRQRIEAQEAEDDRQREIWARDLAEWKSSLLTFEPGERLARTLASGTRDLSDDIASVALQRAKARYLADSADPRIDVDTRIALEERFQGLDREYEGLLVSQATSQTPEMRYEQALAEGTKTTADDLGIAKRWRDLIIGRQAEATNLEVKTVLQNELNAVDARILALQQGGVDEAKRLEEEVNRNVIGYLAGLRGLTEFESNIRERLGLSGSTIVLQNYFQSGPPEAHLWSQQAYFDLKATV